MSEPFLGQISIFGFNFAPRHYAFCDGQILPINQNQSLYSLLGTTFGGDGRTTFALPDLRSRTPIHRGDGHQLGQKSGAETVTLVAAQMPSHQHIWQGSGSGGTAVAAAGNVVATTPNAAYHDVDSPVNMGSSAVVNAGGGQAHDNMQPYTTLSFCIALQGIFPSRN